MLNPESTESIDEIGTHNAAHIFLKCLIHIHDKISLIQKLYLPVIPLRSPTFIHTFIQFYSYNIVNKDDDDQSSH